MSEHTPGPWRVGRPSVRLGVQVFKDRDTPMRSDVICTMPQTGKGRTANARLIAAAPELLAACKEMVKAIGTYRGLRDVKKRFDLCCADAAVNKAIFKATKE